LLDQTLADLSSRSTGLKDQLEIVSMVDSPALQWVLLNYPNARSAGSLSPDELPQVVITEKSAEFPSMAVNYRGQDFVWQLYPGWQGIFPPGFINWLAFRQAPMIQEQVVLWARVDLFPGSSLNDTISPAP